MVAACEIEWRRTPCAATQAFPPALVTTPSGRYAPGVVLAGKYRLESILGEGGMGTVWRARNLRLDLPVAIKLIRPDLDRTSLRARLEVEARAAAKLGHPAIVRVYDIGESELGDPFIVMELMSGETLAVMMSQGRLAAARAVQLLLPIIDALAMTHAQGIVHRDLKPENLMIAREQRGIQPKILDFGIAKMTDPSDGDHKLTDSGMIMGSPDYMSPEQASGREDVDASSDIWAICVVLYEAVTGSTPFSATNLNALLRAIVEDAPKSLVEHAAADQGLWEIVKRGLEKDRKGRQSTMTELGQSLASWLLSHGVLEDACGASLESKWFGNQQPRSVSAVSGSSRPMSATFELRVAHDALSTTAEPDSPALSVTIPARSGRVGAAWAAAFACALLSVLAFGLARTRPAHSNQSPTASDTAHVLRAAQPPDGPMVALPSATSLPPAPLIAERETVPSASLKPPTQPKPRAVKLTSPKSPSLTVHSAAATLPGVRTLPAVPQIAKLGAGPLDLLAPY